MHKYYLFSILGCLLLLSACDKSGPKSMEDLKGGSVEDSMMYYFGQIQANNYWQDAESDTTLATEHSRDEFIRGFRDALKMDQDDDAYNRGLQLGIRLAIRIREFEQRYNVKLPEEVLIAAFENSLKDKNSFNIAEAQKGFYSIKDRYDVTATENDVQACLKNLAKYAKENGFKMISDTLYVKEVTPGSGPKYKLGDRLAVEVTASTIDGKELVTKQFPDSVTLGKGRLRPVVREAVLNMNDGETCQFLTTPRTLLGKRYNTVYKLPVDQPLIFTLKAGQGAGQSRVNQEVPTDSE